MRPLTSRAARVGGAISLVVVMGLTAAIVLLLVREASRSVWVGLVLVLAAQGFVYLCTVLAGGEERGDSLNFIPAIALACVNVVVNLAALVVPDVRVLEVVVLLLSWSATVLVLVQVLVYDHGDADRVAPGGQEFTIRPGRS